MSNYIKRKCLVLFYIAAIFIGGCFPENSLKWSNDGSVGVLCYDNILALVDGKTDTLTKICEFEKENNPFQTICISEDGKLIAYVMSQKCESLDEGLKLLPQNQVELIKEAAEYAKELILLGQTDFEKMDLGPFRGEPTINWVIRYLSENSNPSLIEQLGSDTIEEGKESDIIIYKLFAATPEQISENRPELVTTSLAVICWPQISPDNKFISYTSWNGVFDDNKEENSLRFDLYIASIKSDSKTIDVAEYVTPQYSWRRDSKAITFIEKQAKDVFEDEYSLGVLRTAEVADENDNLLTASEQSAIAAYSCGGKKSDLAGVIFHPFMKVQYSTSGKIFFSSHIMNFPMSNIDDEPRWSLFSYDDDTGSISEILPRDVSFNLGGDNAMGYFDLSPDRKKALLPIANYRFMIYELGKTFAINPATEPETQRNFSQDNSWDMMPSWKGNDEISCFANNKIQFPSKDNKESYNFNEEIVILKSNGEFDRVLSENWPD
ncbi:MAG: hypothetical protein JXA96_16645 [Sedimentisphaerales bacterium]|nr:hypothetical protein [Sedimentisphaerales bacterium]